MGDGAERGIARRMAVAVVDLLEMVDIPQHHREGLTLQPEGLQLLLGTAPVGQFGERIGAGEAAHLFHHALQVMDIAEGDDMAIRDGIGPQLGGDDKPARLAALAVDQRRHLGDLQPLRQALFHLRVPGVDDSAAIPFIRVGESKPGGHVRQLGKVVAELLKEGLVQEAVAPLQDHVGRAAIVTGNGF